MDGSEGTYRNHFVGGVFHHLKELQDEPRRCFWVNRFLLGRNRSLVSGLHPFAGHGERGSDCESEEVGESKMKEKKEKMRLRNDMCRAIDILEKSLARRHVIFSKTPTESSTQRSKVDTVWYR